MKMRLDHDDSGTFPMVRIRKDIYMTDKQWDDFVIYVDKLVEKSISYDIIYNNELGFIIDKDTKELVHADFRISYNDILVDHLQILLPTKIKDII